MSYLISCIFMKGATQLGPCAVEKENKELSTPTPGMKNGIVEMSLPRKSLSDCIFYFERREIEFAGATKGNTASFGYKGQAVQLNSDVGPLT